MDVCTSGARYTMEKIKQFGSSPVGIFLYSLGTGIIGVVILLGFLSMIFSASNLPLLLPAILAFNGASSGYSLVDKRPEGFAYKNLTLIALALPLSLAGILTISLFCPWEPLLDGRRFVIAISSTLLFTFLGAWIGTKKKKINR